MAQETSAVCWLLEWDSSFFGFRIGQAVGQTSSSKKRASYSGMVSSEFGTVPLFPSRSEVGIKLPHVVCAESERRQPQKNETPERIR
jgi:hypothetical protein